MRPQDLKLGSVTPAARRGWTFVVLALAVGLRLVSGIIDYVSIGIVWFLVVGLIVLPGIFTLDGAAFAAAAIAAPERR